MKILHISTSDSGGAANAGIRLHQGLLNARIDSKVLVFLKKKNVEGVYQFYENKHSNFVLDKYRFFKFAFYEGINRLHLLGRDKSFEIFTSPVSLIDIINHPLVQEADIIHLHWIAYFLDYPSFFKKLKNKKIVWTLHDMNPFTGGCHHARECTNYKKDCSNCPQLKGSISQNYANKNFNIKKNALSEINSINIVTPSNWLLEKSKSSSLFSKYHHKHIFNGINTEQFKLLDNNKAKRELGLPIDKTNFLFVSDLVENKEKGFDLLYKAINQINADNFILSVVGKTKLDLKNKKINYIGYVKGLDKMNLVYSAADAFVIPSLEDNLPNTVIESLLCGTPVIGFPTGGIPEMIIHQENGLIVEDKSSEALTSAISDFLLMEKNFDREEIRNNAIEKYSLDNQVKKYIEVYKNIPGI